MKELREFDHTGTIADDVWLKICEIATGYNVIQ